MSERENVLGSLNEAARIPVPRDLPPLNIPRRSYTDLPVAQPTEQDDFFRPMEGVYEMPIGPRKGDDHDRGFINLRFEDTAQVAVKNWIKFPNVYMHTRDLVAKSVSEGHLIIPIAPKIPLDQQIDAYVEESIRSLAPELQSDALHEIFHGTLEAQQQLQAVIDERDREIAKKNVELADAQKVILALRAHVAEKASDEDMLVFDKLAGIATALEDDDITEKIDTGSKFKDMVASLIGAEAAHAIGLAPHTGDVSRPRIESKIS